MDAKTIANEIQSRLAANSFRLESERYFFGSVLSGRNPLLAKRDRKTPAGGFVTIAGKRTSVAGASTAEILSVPIGSECPLNRIKRNKRIRDRAECMSDWLVAVEAAPLEEHQIQKLVSELAELPEKQRSVLVLKFYRDKTFREIGTLLGISERSRKLLPVWN